MSKKFLILLITIALLLIFKYEFPLYVVAGNSMDPTLQDKQHILVCKDCKIEANNIIVFKPIDGERAVKRVIGLKGDDISRQKTYLSINGIKTEIPFQGKCTNKGDYFVVGDNYLNSHDSRNYCWISKEQIVGKVIIK